MKLSVSLVVGAIDLAVRSLGPETKRSVQRRVVLYYHSVSQQQRENFARQMDMLLGFSEALPLDSLGRPGIKAFGTAVTFDDGYKTILDNAVPELVKRRIPFTIFIPSGNMGNFPKWLGKAESPACGRIMNENELKDLAGNGLATFGSHCVNHPNLMLLDDLTAKNEFADSKKALESVLDLPVDFLSFPYGEFKNEHIELARWAGYRHVFTTIPSVISSGENNYAIGRVWTDPDDWDLEFRLKLSGAYRWTFRASALRRKIFNFSNIFKFLEKAVF